MYDLGSGLLPRWHQQYVDQSPGADVDVSCDQFGDVIGIEKALVGIR